MNIFGFHSVVKSEKRAQKYLRKYWRKNGRVLCINCGSPKVYQISGQRYRCRRCKNRFSELSGTWIRKLKISSAQWLWIIKLFELEMSARKISQQIDLSYPTVLKATNLIRQSIVANLNDWNWLQGEVEADDAYFGGKRKGKRGRGARNKIPVFGILERNGQVKVEVVKRLTAETICGLTV